LAGKRGENKEKGEKGKTGGINNTANYGDSGQGKGANRRMETTWWRGQELKWGEI